MRLDDFKRWVQSEFGPNLEHATPANVREFLDRAHAEFSQKNGRKRIVIDEPATSYEEILRDFFARVLDKPNDDALIILWMLALELSFAGVRDHWADRVGALFPSLDDPD